MLEHISIPLPLVVGKMQMLAVGIAAAGGSMSVYRLVRP